MPEPACPRTSARARGVLSFFLLSVLVATVSVADEREDRLFDAVFDIYQVRIHGGETDAIDRILDCYRSHTRPGAGLTPGLERCIVQDVAFAYFSNSLRGHAFDEDYTPEFSAYEITESRIDDALDIAGLDEETQHEVMNELGSITFRSAQRALDKARNEPPR